MRTNEWKIQSLKLVRSLGVVVAMLVAAGWAPALAQPVTLKFATEATPGDHLHYVAAEWLRDSMARASNGQVKVEIFHSGTLGNEPDLVDGLRIGSVDATIVVLGNLSTVVPEFSLFSASYLFSGYDHVRRTLATPKFVQRMDEITASKNVGLRLLGTSVLGPRFVFAARPVRSLADLSGLKMRVIPNPVETQIWTALGAITTPMPSTEIYGAMQARVIDGAEGSIPYIHQQKLYEVGRYIVLTRHQFALSAILVSQRALNRLTPAQRAMLSEAAVAVASRGIDHTEASVDQYIQLVSKQPRVEVITVDTHKFSERVAPLHAEIAARLGVSDILNMVEAAR